MSNDRVNYIDLVDVILYMKAASLWLSSGALVGAVLAVTASFGFDPWYESEVLVAPSGAGSAPSLQGGLGGIAALAGVNLGNADADENLAILRSRDFAESLIEELGIAGAIAKRIGIAAADTAAASTVSRVSTYFLDNVLSVSEEPGSSLVRLKITWTDPVEAAEWANAAVRKINELARARAVQQSSTNLEYLRGQLGTAQPLAVQEAIARLLEQEMQTGMIAAGRVEFAYSLIDDADVPVDPAAPKRAVFAVIGAFLGALFSLALRRWYRAESKC